MDAGEDALGRAWAFLKEGVAADPEIAELTKALSIVPSVVTLVMGGTLTTEAALGNTGLLPAGLILITVGMGATPAAFLWVRAARLNHGRSQRARARRVQRGREPATEGDGPPWAVLQTGRGTVLRVSAHSHIREDVTYLWTSRLRPAGNGMVRIDRPVLTQVNGARPDPAVRRWTETRMGEDIHVEPGGLEEEYDRTAAQCGDATWATESLVAEEERENGERAEREAQRDRIFQRGEEKGDT